MLNMDRQPFLFSLPQSGKSFFPSQIRCVYKQKKNISYWYVLPILLSRKPDSNRRPIHYEWIALPTELFRRYIVFLKCDAKVVNNILLAKFFAYFFFKAVIFMVWRLSLVLKSFSDSLWSWHKQWCAAWHFSFSGDMFIAHWLSEKGRNFHQGNFEVYWKSVGLFFLESTYFL